MKSGHVNQYSHFSEFKSIHQFNETIKQQLATHSGQLTNGELLAFNMLTRFSVKVKIHAHYSRFFHGLKWKGVAEIMCSSTPWVSN